MSENTPHDYEMELAKHKTEMSVPEWAEKVDERIREIVGRAQSDFIECGLLVREMDENLLWAHINNPDTDLPYGSFPEWANRTLGYGRSTYMEAKRVVKEFNDLPLKTLQEIPRCNFKHFRLLPESKRTAPEWMKAVMGPEKELIAKIKNDAPELHVEHKQRLIFSLYESSLNVVDKCIEMKLKELRHDDPNATKEDALEQICNDWLEGYV